MIQLHQGQCGLCAHFGEPHLASQQLIQIRQTSAASEQFVDECGHPDHFKLHLKVSASSGCDGFEPASSGIVD